MKFYFTVATLALWLVIPPLRADEPKASAPAVLDNPVADPYIIEHDADPVPRKIRKVATDYAPAQDLLLSAMSLIGVKYKWGGSTPESGLDCSGFINYVFKNSLNVVLPRTALGMSNMGENVEKEELKPGDLVFFNTLKRKFSHVGIYMGDGRFIHAPRSGRNIEIANLDEHYWVSRFNGARRIGELGEMTSDMATLLAGRSLRQPESAGTRSCRKITMVRKGKKHTSTVCVSRNSVKSKSKSTRKALTSTKRKSLAKKPVLKVVKKAK